MDRRTVLAVFLSISVYYGWMVLYVPSFRLRETSRSWKRGWFWKPLNLFSRRHNPPRWPKCSKRHRKRSEPGALARRSLCSRLVAERCRI